MKIISPLCSFWDSTEKLYLMKHWSYTGLLCGGEVSAPGLGAGDWGWGKDFNL